MAKVITESIETVMKRWAPIVEAGPEKIESFQVKKAVSQLLENTAKEFAKHGILTEAMGVSDALGTSPVQGKKSTGYLKGTFGREKGGDGDFSFLLLQMCFNTSFFKKGGIACEKAGSPAEMVGDTERLAGKASWQSRLSVCL